MNGGFLASLFFAFPIIFFSCRNNFISIIKVLSERNTKERWREERRSIEQISDYVQEDDIEEKRRKVRLLYTLSTVINLVVIVLIAMFVENIESVFNLVGAISCSAQGILFPLYFYLRLTQMKGKKKKGVYYVSMVVLAVMVPFSIFAVIALYI
jgi:amino acid permease